MSTHKSSYECLPYLYSEMPDMGSNQDALQWLNREEKLQYIHTMEYHQQHKDEISSHKKIILGPLNAYCLANETKLHDFNYMTFRKKEKFGHSKEDQGLLRIQRGEGE